MPPAQRTAARSYDPARVRKALIGQVEAIAGAAHPLSAEQRGLPTGLPGWDVHTLLVHMALQIDVLPRSLAAPTPAARAAELGPPGWALRTAGAAAADPAERDAATRQEAARTADGAARIDEAAAQLEPVLEQVVRDDLLVPHAFGAMRMLDLTVTRLVELAVHSDDLARATGVRAPLDRQALATAVRVLTDALAAAAPGGAVEVRVPPFAVTQCIAGPRHTRGTPPGVVEVDPVSWLRLATGRTDWAAALDTGTVTATGERADLAPYLPLLR